MSRCGSDQRAVMPCSVGQRRTDDYLAVWAMLCGELWLAVFGTQRDVHYWIRPPEAPQRYHAAHSDRTPGDP